MPTLYAAIMNLMTEACDEKLVLTAPQMKDLFRLGLAAVRQTQRVASSSDTLPTIWRPTTWDALHIKVASSERFKASASLQTMCLQMTRLSKGTACPKPKIVERENNNESAVAKRKADRSGDDEDSAATRKVKRKKLKKAKA